MVTINKIEQGIAAYLDGELMPKLPSTGIEKVLAGTALSLAIRKSGGILEGYKDNKAMQMLGVMDVEGNVDVDILAEELKKNIPAEGVTIDIPIIGTLIIKSEDVDKLHEYITLV